MTDPSIHRDLGKLQGTVEAFTGEVRAWRKGIEDRLSAVEGRVEGIENREAERSGAVKAAKWAWGALSAFLGLLAGAFGSGYLAR